ncbi:MAG: recombinase family protein [Oscillospiraceae bacterium]|nr:recombinase family protein [Oscillospiraceae bacterium]
MLKNRSIPFGYCVVNGKYALNATEAEAVKRIFEQYIGGKSLKAIAAEMTVPYILGKPDWNKNMVCRVIENRKYLGEGGFPRIISDDDFKRAAEIKAERNTYRKPASQAKPQLIQAMEIPITEYAPTEEIERMISEINRLIESENADKNTITELIIKCAQLKYSAIKEVR